MSHIKLISWWYYTWSNKMLSWNLSTRVSKLDSISKFQFFQITRKSFFWKNENCRWKSHIKSNKSCVDICLIGCPKQTICQNFQNFKLEIEIDGTMHCCISMNNPNILNFSNYKSFMKCHESKLKIETLIEKAIEKNE